MQCSNILEMTGLIAIPLKSSQVNVLLTNSFGFGIGTMQLYLNATGTHEHRIIIWNSLAKITDKDG